MSKYKLSELYTLQMGKTPSRDNSSYWNNGNNKWISIADLSKSGQYISETKEKISDSAVKDSGIKLIPKNTLIMSFKLSIGKVALTACDMYSNEAIMSFIDNNLTEIIPEYAYYLFSAQKWDKGSNRAVMGKTLNKATLSLYDINIHPVDEQREIIEKLGKLNNLIELRKRELIKLDNLVKSQFIEMFGNQAKNEKGFDYGCIEDVADIYLGLTHTPTYTDKGIKFISAKNTSGDELDMTDIKYISQEEFNSAPIGAKPIRNDVLFSRVGSNLGHPVILDTDEKLCTFVSLGFLRTKGKVSSLYLKHWMRDTYFMLQVKSSVMGGGQPNLNTGWLKKFKIIIPPKELQNEFARFVKQTDKSKFRIKQSLEKLETCYKALLQKYFG